jgi:ketosteroid isomerase-like protein
MNKVCILIFSGALLTALVGCVKEADHKDHSEALAATRVAWGEAIAEGNVDKIFSFWTEDVVIYPVSGEVIRGIGEVREYVRHNRQVLGIRPRVTPITIVASESGDLGYTIGTHEWIDNEGNVTMPGRYVTLWRKNDRGLWKCFLEIHSPRTPDERTDTEADK